MTDIINIAQNQAHNGDAFETTDKNNKITAGKSMSGRLLCDGECHCNNHHKNCVAVQITDTADNAAHLQLLRLTHNRRSSCDPFAGMPLAGSNNKTDAER